MICECQFVLKMLFEYGKHTHKQYEIRRSREFRNYVGKIIELTTSLESRLTCAIRFHDTHVFLKYLVQIHEFPKNNDAIYWASYCNQKDILKILLQYYPSRESVNYTNTNGRTGLHWAAEKGFSEIVKLLLNNRYIEINVQNRKGNTPLMMAIKYSHEWITHLLQSRVDIDLTLVNESGHTVYDLAEEKIIWYAPDYDL